nr:fibroin heavy chain-like [Aegilops tauschii subsp. strangulata]
MQGHAPGHARATVKGARVAGMPRARAGVARSRGASTLARVARRGSGYASGATAGRASAWRVHGDEGKVGGGRGPHRAGVGYGQRGSRWGDGDDTTWRKQTGEVSPATSSCGEGEAASVFGRRAAASRVGEVTRRSGGEVASARWWRDEAATSEAGAAATAGSGAVGGAQLVLAEEVEAVDH